jgi:hypothetical protein
MATAGLARDHLDRLDLVAQLDQFEQMAQS